MKLGNLIQAMRLPFTTASALPYIYGGIAAEGRVNYERFLLGLAAVICTHISANMINDFADSKSGADWSDVKYYGLFGGSKLIQQKILSEGFYRNTATMFAAAALASIAVLTVMGRNLAILGFYAVILALSWAYSHAPLNLSYRRLGELVVFLLFGPAVVMGGMYIQTGIFPTMQGFVMSLPFGFLTTAILFANEIPDYETDMKAGKRTWINVVGPRHSFVVYGILMLAGFAVVGMCIFRGYMGPWAVISLIAVFPVTKALFVVKRHYSEKERLLESSRLTIMAQAFVGAVLVGDALLWR